MIRVLSKEEEIAHRKENFGKLSPGCLFNLAKERYFIAIRKIDEQSWEVIKLDERNRQSIINDQPCKRSTLSFDQMVCLNV